MEKKTAGLPTALLPWMLLLGFSGTAGAADHPSLVEVEATDCAICHEGLIEDQVSVHPPAAEDCTTCHEMSIGDGGTTVELIDAEPALCVMCHDELEGAVDADLETPHFPVTDSCLTCHDPHSSAQAHVLAAAVPGLCSDCHDLVDLGLSHGGQVTAATNCASCHQPHGSDQPSMLLGSVSHSPFAEGSCDACHRQPFGDRIRLRVRGERLCEACHGDVTELESNHGSVHAATQGERGRAGCLSCHNPHMSNHTTLLNRSGNSLCAGCHADVVTAASADTGHYPAGDDCLTCHLPHASPEGKLLNAAPDSLCTDCHDVDDQDLTAAHLGANLSSLDCTSCHSPHGAGHPKLLAENLHYPVLDGCDTCHEGGHDELMEDGESELCLYCHEGIGELAEMAEVPHGALEFGACRDCHNPHASPQKRLVKSPGAGPCVDCHDEQVAGDGEVAHGVIDLVGCYACHEPHGGTNEKLLRETGRTLCLSCHDRSQLRIDATGDTATLLGRFEIPAARAQAATKMVLSADQTRNHPVTNHPVAGEFTPSDSGRVAVNFEGTLECLTCHDPHKGASSKILRWNAATATEACTACHLAK